MSPIVQIHAPDSSHEAFSKEQFPYQAFMGKWYVVATTLPLWNDKKNVTITYAPVPSEKDGAPMAFDDIVEYHKKTENSARKKKRTIIGVDTIDQKGRNGASWQWSGRGVLFIATSHWQLLGYHISPRLSPSGGQQHNMSMSVGPTASSTSAPPIPGPGTVPAEAGQAMTGVVLERGEGLVEEEAGTKGSVGGQAEKDMEPEWALTYFSSTLFTPAGLDIYARSPASLTPAFIDAIIKAVRDFEPQVRDENGAKAEELRTLGSKFFKVEHDRDE